MWSCILHTCVSLLVLTPMTFHFTVVMLISSQSISYQHWMWGHNKLLCTENLASWVFFPKPSLPWPFYLVLLFVCYSWFWLWHDIWIFIKMIYRLKRIYQSINIMVTLIMAIFNQNIQADLVNIACEYNEHTLNFHQLWQENPWE